MQTFQQPLTRKEEELYLTRLQEEDKEKREEAKQILIERNLRLVVYIARKFENTGINIEDLISIGTIGLIKAINTFQYGKNTQFSTYAARCIENEILMLLRVNKKHSAVMSLNECLGKDKEGNEICVMDIVQNEGCDVIESVENNILTEKLLEIIKNVLSDREYEIICLRYGIGSRPAYTQREIAKMLGISRSYISRLEKKAIDIMREYVSKNDVYI